MRVTISVFGRFHAFNLACQLSRRGHLNRLITSYPAFEVEKYGVPKERIRALPHYEALKRGWGRLEKWLPMEGESSWINRGFEWSASRYIPEDTDIFVGWSGTAQRGLSRAKDVGAKAVLERGSSHIVFQRDILKKEEEKLGIDISLPDPKTVEKEKQEYEQADKIIVPSRFVENSFVEYGMEKSKLIRIPYGVNVKEFRKNKKKDDVFRVIYAGQMMLRKGVHYLLKAFYELDLPDAELWLIGSKREEIEPYFKKYEGSFKFLGHKPQSELYKYYSQGSVFAMCSLEEGLAMVQPQAMSCGLPLICTTNTGGEDLMSEKKEEGFVIPIRDTEKLKEKLLWCYENREACRVMGDAARRRVEKNFKWEDYGDRVVNAYSELLN